MPIRFACPHCRQKLSVSSRKAGATADCPRCKASLTIPNIPESAPAREGSAVATAAPPSAAPFDFVAGDQPELVYDTSDDAVFSARQDNEHLDLLSIPRYVLYLQGGLLAVVALASFAIGIITGGAFSTPSGSPGGGRQLAIEGTVSFSVADRAVPDPGAVVLLLPVQAARPDEKAPVDGLRPIDPTPDESHRGIAIVRQLGGAYARTDEHGRFQARLPGRGRYLALVISRSLEPPDGPRPIDEDVAKLKPFFDDAAQLLNSRRYQLTLETVRGDQQFNVVFD